MGLESHGYVMLYDYIILYPFNTNCIQLQPKLIQTIWGENEWLCFWSLVTEIMSVFKHVWSSLYNHQVEFILMDMAHIAWMC